MDDIRMRLVRFKWGDGRRTYLWPDHPLVLAGDRFLELVVEALQKGIPPDIVALTLSNEATVPLSDATSYVECIGAAINGISSDNVANAGRPDAESLGMATLNLTRACNLRCRHCYAGDRLSAGLAELTSDEIESAIRQLSSLVIREPRLLIISGGEPLLRKPQLLRAVSVGRECGFRVRVNTNGLLLDRDTAMLLAEHDVLTQVSLDGADAATNAVLRGPQSAFDRTVRALELLVAAGCRTRVSTTLHRGNASQVPALVRLAADIGAEQLVTSSLVAIGNARSEKLLPITFAEEFTIVYEAVRDNVKYQRMTMSTLLAETISAIRNGMRFVYCGTGCSTVCVDSDGTVYPCINMTRPEFAIGNTTSGRLREIWRSSHVLTELRELDVSSMNGRCARCVFRHLCGGYCRGETLAAGLDLRSPYVRCSEWIQGLTRIMDILSKSPDLYEAVTSPGNIGQVHRE